MSSQLTMGSFRDEMKKYDSFKLSYDNPLSPLKFSVPLTEVIVCLSASPYIFFRGETFSFALNYIDSIKDIGLHNTEHTFVVACKNYLSGQPSVVQFLLSAFVV